MFKISIFYSIIYVLRLIIITFNSLYRIWDINDFEDRSTRWRILIVQLNAFTPLFTAFNPKKIFFDLKYNLKSEITWKYVLQNNRIVRRTNSTKRIYLHSNPVSSEHSYTEWGTIPCYIKMNVFNLIKRPVVAQRHKVWL